MPFQPWAAEPFQQRLRAEGKNSLLAYCVSSGEPPFVTVPLPYKIVQTLELILVLRAENEKDVQHFQWLTTRRERFMGPVERQRRIAERVRAAAMVAALAGGSIAVAQTSVNVALPNVAAAAVLSSLAKECYEAGMVAQPVSDSIMDCSAVLEERSPGSPERGPDDAVVVRHRLRFTLLERAGEVRVTADAWTETEELGITFDEPLASETYLRRVRDVLADVGKRLAAPGGDAPPWVGRYESEQAWHLDAHLRAVRHCDANLASLNADALGRDLQSLGLRPQSDDARDRCEQLYQHLFEWGLARGETEPSVAAYSRYRETLPPEQRACAGRLALQAPCE